jgi:hypothetical protein
MLRQRLISCAPTHESRKAPFFITSRAKTALALATADYWTQTTAAIFEQAPFHLESYPLERLLGYLNFRKTLLTGEISELPLQRIPVMRIALTPKKRPSVLSL